MSGDNLVVGTFVKYDDRIWRVGLVNQSRARLDPITGTVHKLLTAEFMTYGASVNISPTSPLELVENLSLDQMRRAERLIGRSEESFIVDQPKVKEGRHMAAAEATAAVAQPTVSDNKKANKERLAALKAKDANKKVEKAAAKVAAPPKEAKSVRPCGCGCGEQVSSYFAQGHDARYKGLMIKVERGTVAVKDLPPLMQKQEFVKKGDGYVTKKNYKGEPHKGYDKVTA